jgi:hypothetical protein
VRRWPSATVAKGLRQHLHELARNSQIRRFKSFREAAVYESEVIAGLIALSAFGEQPCLGYCRPELQRERGLRLCDRKRLSSR